MVSDLKSKELEIKIIKMYALQVGCSREKKLIFRELGAMLDGASAVMGDCKCSLEVRGSGMRIFWGISAMEVETKWWRCL